MPRALSGWRRWALFASILVVVLSALDYLYGVNSDAMAFARESLQSSESIRRQVGPVKSVELGWLWGFRQKSGFRGPRATLHLSVAGPLGKVHVIMEVQEIDGQWRVIHTSTPM